MAQDSESLRLLEDARVSDHLVRAAYEEASPSHKALLKTALSVGEKRVRCSLYASCFERRSDYPSLGLRHAASFSPLDWICLVIPEGFRAAARVLAAASIPRYLGISCVFAVFLGDPSSEVLLSLELGGCEDLFLVRDLSPLLETLRNLSPCGALASFAPLPSPLRAFPDICLEKEPPHLALLSPQLFSKETLRFLHGSLPFSSTLSSDTCAVFASDDLAKDLLSQKKSRRLLILTPGFEGCWHFAGLSSDCFLQSSELFIRL